MQIWHATALNLPSWLTDADDHVGSRLTILKRHGLDVVLTPDHEEVVLVTESGSHMQAFLWQDVLQLRKWKERGGPKWEPGTGVNLQRGERMRICPVSALGGREAEYEQPWEKR